MPHKRVTQPDHRIALAHALGYLEYPSDSTAEPFLAYIANCHTGRGTLDDYLQLFVRVIAHFSSAEKPSSTRSIRALLDALIASDTERRFADTRPGSRQRKEDVEDTLMCIMGIWSLLLSSFVQLPNGVRNITATYSLRAQGDGMKGEPFDEDLAGLVRGSGLLTAHNHLPQHSPQVGLDDEVVQTAMKLVSLLNQSNGMGSDNLFLRSRTSSVPWPFTHSTSTMMASHVSNHALDAVDHLEALSIKATRLNAFTLNALAAVGIAWTHNISRHMLLSRRGGRYVLEIFVLPCVFNAASLTSEAVGIPPELAQEIQESYCILFNPWPEQPIHAKIWRWMGIRKCCWCWSCSVHRYRARVIHKYRNTVGAKSHRISRKHRSHRHSEYDPSLVKLMNGTEAADWTQDLFPHLWPRILLLEEHLQLAKPRGIWVLFWDRRDTLQFWTFFFATVVVVLTFLQVALGVAQVVGTFQ